MLLLILIVVSPPDYKAKLQREKQTTNRSQILAVEKQAKFVLFKLFTNCY